MSTSDKQIAANRVNGRKSQGPKDTTSTRTNASKHGLSAAGVTALDSAEGFRTILSDLEKEKNPVGTIEMFLVESVGLEMLRLRRARLLEAQHIDGSLNPPYRILLFRPLVHVSSAEIDPGLPASICKLEDVHPLVQTTQRWHRGDGFTEDFPVRSTKKLERLQRIGSNASASAACGALDVSVHHDTGMQSDTMPLPQEESLGDKGR